jgi:transcriptional regulator with PAS, ATPase and Fis domain
MSRSPEITPECFPLQILAPETGAPANAQSAGAPPIPSGRTKMQTQEYRNLNAALARHAGNLAAVAEELGISRVTLWRKRKKYNL